MTRLLALLAAGLVPAATMAAPPPAETEFAEMLASILTGSQMAPGDGWFHPAQSRLTWDKLAAAHAVKPGASIPQAKFRGPADLFARLDRDGDGKLTAADLDWSDRSVQLRQQAHARGLLRRWDGDSDNKLTKEEWAKVFEKAAGKKEKLDADDVRKLLYPTDPMPNFSNPADAPSTFTLLRGLFLNEIGSTFPGPSVGDVAPDFTLETHDGKQTIRLADHFGKTPVVLVFGNFTCGPFRSQYPAVEALKKVYGDKVTFLGVYVREAHPEDGWHMPSNDKQGVKLPQPRTTPERVQVATTCVKNLKMTMPLLVDSIRDTVGHAYSGMPSRFILIDRSGKVAYKSGRGPFGFRAPELDQQIALLLTEETLAKPKPDAGGQSRVPLLSDAETWARLPALASGAKEGPLPNWAKAFAQALPRTTAGMLETDYAQRAKNPLDPKLRAMIRYAAADAVGCEYGRQYAKADGAVEPVTFAEKTTAAFARKLTTAAYKITDAEFAEMRRLHGDANAVAVVLTVAYASFQDRLLLTLNVPVEVGGPLPPRALEFAKPYAGYADAPARVLPTVAAADRGKVTDTEWKSMDFDGLQKLLADQHERPGRIPVPTFEELLKASPTSYDAKKPLRIKWSLVCMGYQPTLAGPWLNGMRTFAQESKQDRVFEELLFWVVTRSLQCFY